MRRLSQKGMTYFHIQFNPADILYLQIPNHSPYVPLGEFVIMRNHMHGI
jgi:hypothetical protein